MTKLDFLKEYQTIANTHASRLLFAVNKVELWLPVTEEFLKNLENEDVAILDMLTSRFGKLQDLIGSKIFPLILDILGENDLSFKDKLHKLEKLKIIKDAEWWMQVREVRNQLIHDYPDDYDMLAANLNQMLPSIKALLSEWESIQKNTIASL